MYWNRFEMMGEEGSESTWRRISSRAPLRAEVSSGAGIKAPKWVKVSLRAALKMGKEMGLDSGWVLLGYWGEVGWRVWRDGGMEGA